MKNKTNFNLVLKAFHLSGIYFSRIKFLSLKSLIYHAIVVLIQSLHLKSMVAIFMAIFYNKIQVEGYNRKPSYIVLFMSHTLCFVLWFSVFLKRRVIRILIDEVELVLKKKLNALDGRMIRITMNTTLVLGSILPVISSMVTSFLTPEDNITIILSFYFFHSIPGDPRSKLVVGNALEMWALSFVTSLVTVLYTSLCIVLKFLLLRCKRLITSADEMQTSDANYKAILSSHLYHTTRRIERLIEKALSPAIFVVLFDDFVMMFISVGVMFSLFDVTNALLYAIFLLTLMLLKSCSFFSIVVIAAQVHETDVLLREDFRRLYWDHQNVKFFATGRESLLKCRKRYDGPFLFTAWNIFKLNRNFMAGALGALLTYGLLFLQLKSGSDGKEFRTQSAMEGFSI